MNDKERILMSVIRGLRSTTGLVRNNLWGSENYKRDGGDGYYVHFAPWKDPQKGDLVLCEAMSIDDWSVGFVHMVISNHECIIREIGSDRLCRVSNEGFSPIIGMSSIDLLEGAQYGFYQKVLKAFRKGDEFLYCFGGIDFDGEDAIIWVRERYGGIIRFREHGSAPFSIRMRWSDKTTIKAILQAMRDGGYGTREFIESVRQVE
jgi:hypothetical protein